MRTTTITICFSYSSAGSRSEEQKLLLQKFLEDILMTTHTKLQLLTCAVEANSLNALLTFPSKEQLEMDKLLPYALPCLVKDCEINQKNLVRHLCVKHHFTLEQAEAIKTISINIRNAWLSPAAYSTLRQELRKGDTFRIIIDSFERLIGMVAAENRSMLTNVLSLQGGLTSIMDTNRLDHVSLLMHILSKSQ